MGLDEACGWARAWPLTWPRVRKLALEVEENVRLSGRPWAEAWTSAEATARAKAEAQATAQAEAGVDEAAWRAHYLRGSSSLEDALAMRIVKETEEEASLESSKIGWTRTWILDAKGQGEAEALALALAGVWGWARSEARARGERPPRTLADPSTIWRILTILSRSGLARVLWHNSPETRDEYSCIIHFISPITRLPFELLHQIVLTIVENTSGPPSTLMLVCKHWHTIVTSFWASLNLGTWSPVDAVTSKLERSQWLLDIVVDTESDRGYFIPSCGAFGAIFSAMEASSRWRSLEVKSFPPRADLPEDLVNRRLQRCCNTTMSRFTTFKIKSACETSPLLNGLLSILGVAASPELATVEINSPNAISFLASAYPSIFHSVKVLALDTPGIPNPVDLLPHLHQLESFTASHISFPVYYYGTDLPLVHTLHRLSLKAVSIQWMSGRTFHVLEHCTLIFPLHRQVLHTFKAVLPNCRHLTFQGVPLDILNNISAKKLIHLSVTCSSSFGRCGARQLVRFSQGFRESQLTPNINILHIDIEAASRAWIYVLAFLPGLEELVIHSPRPSSLGAKVFQSLIVLPVDSNNLGTISTPGRSSTPLLPLLQRFVLKYGRWLRQSEQFDLIPVLMSIIRSRQHFNVSLKRFGLQMRSDQNDPLELIGRFGVHVEGFMRLANESGIKAASLPFTAEEMVQASSVAGSHLAFRRPSSLAQETGGIPA